MKTDFNKIIYNDPDHTYRLDNEYLLNVTSVLDRIKPPFNKESMSLYVASRDDKSQAEVLKDWEKTSNDAKKKGSILHNYVENKLLGLSNFILDLNSPLPEMLAFDRAWQMLQTNVNAKLIQKELVIGDKALRVAGRVDAIIEVTESTYVDSNGLDISASDIIFKDSKPIHKMTGKQASIKSSIKKKCIFDWKTGKKFNTFNNYGRLLSPFNDIDDCELNIYSLQTSLYRLILDRNTSDIYGDNYMVHLHENNFHIYRAKDYRVRLLDWLSSTDIRYDSKLEETLLTISSALSKKVSFTSLRKVSNEIKIKFADDLTNALRLVKSSIPEEDKYETL